MLPMIKWLLQIWRCLEQFSTLKKKLLYKFFSYWNTLLVFSDLFCNNYRQPGMCKSRTETSNNLGPVFLIAYILYKNRTLSKLGNGHCYNVDISFYHMCWHHHSQDTHLFHHHKGLLPVAPIGTLTILPPWSLGTIPKLLATTYQSLFLSSWECDIMYSYNIWPSNANL